MAVKNSLAKKDGNMKIGAYLSQDAVRNRINETVGGKDGQRLITAIVSATTSNPALQDCTNQSILSAALVGEGIKLSPSPQLGHYYMVPFKNNNLGVTEAQFVLGYKGYIQLALRSGQYKKLNVVAIKEGELVHFDPLNEEIEVNLIQDELVRENTPTQGYYAMFEYVNGFKKAMYWSKEKMEAHAMKYSKGYQAKKGYTFWEKDFDGMAFKTMLRQLISKWGIMSIEMQTAMESDMAVIRDDGSKNYVDNEDGFEEVNETVQAEEPVETPIQELQAEPSENNDVAAALFD